MDRQQRIAAAVKSVSQTPDADPAADELLFESGALDSFGLPDLVAALESEFRVRIPDSELLPRNFSSINRIDSYLNGKGV